MILILFNTVIENYLKCLNELNFIIFKLNNNSNNNKHFISNNSIHESSKPLFIQQTDYQFIHRNLFQKFINKYWQETIFISKSSLLSESYINKLKTTGLSIYKNNDYKNFLVELSKALLNGKLQISIDDNKTNSDLFKYDNHIYMKYIWRKGLNLSFTNLRHKQAKIDKLDIVSSNKITHHSLPIFAITNESNELIMAESSEEILFHKSFIALCLNWFKISLFQNVSDKKKYMGLLFINPEDANEYRQDILYKYSTSSRNSDIKYFIGYLKLYYQLLHASIYNTEFHLIPDLKEVSDLIYKYQHYSHLYFDKSQKYGKNHFQGQPIYLIKSVLAVNKNTQQKDLVNYSYNIKYDSNIQEYQAVFLNYKTALFGWNQFRELHLNYKLPTKPSLYISNLEEFLNNYKTSNKNIIFVPSSDTYQFITQHIKLNKTNKINQLFIQNISYIKNSMIRAMWSLTSRQPTNW